MMEWAVPVGIAPNEPGPGSGKNPFCARVLDGPAIGVFAYGDTFASARSALVEVLWAYADCNPELGGVATIELAVLSVKHFTRTSP